MKLKMLSLFFPGHVEEKEEEEWGMYELQTEAA